MQDCAFRRLISFLLILICFGLLNIEAIKAESQRVAKDADSNEESGTYRLNPYLQFGYLFTRDTDTEFIDYYIEESIGGGGIELERTLMGYDYSTIGGVGAVDYFGFEGWDCGWPSCDATVWTFKAGGFWHYRISELIGFNFQPSLLAVLMNTTQSIEEDKFTVEMTGGGIEIYTGITVGRSVRMKLGPYYQIAALIRENGKSMSFENYGVRIGLSINL